MKIILTGVTGYIGTEVLNQCLSHPGITSIVVLSRRALTTTHPKLRVILHDDFTHYPPAVLSELSGAEACIFCLGTGFPLSPPEVNRKVNYDYAFKTAKMFEELLNEQKIQNFKFIYLSGALVIRDQNAKLWFLEYQRKLKGELENDLLQLNQDSSNAGFEIVVARPGLVFGKGSVISTWIVGKISHSIMLHHLAAGLIQTAIEGHSEPLLENDALNALGKRVLAPN